MQAGNSNFSPITLFQIGFQDYFGRGIGISTLKYWKHRTTASWHPSDRDESLSYWNLCSQVEKQKPLSSCQHWKIATLGLSKKDQMRKKAAAKSFSTAHWHLPAVSSNMAKRCYLGLCWRHQAEPCTCKHSLAWVREYAKQFHLEFRKQSAPAWVISWAIWGFQKLHLHLPVTLGEWQTLHWAVLLTIPAENHEGRRGRRCLL